MKILTVCGNGIGSSLMLKMKLEQILQEEGLTAEVESADFSSAQGIPADLIVTVKELAEQFVGKKVVIVDSYINKERIKEQVLTVLQEILKKK